MSRHGIGPVPRRRFIGMCLSGTALTLSASACDLPWLTATPAKPEKTVVTVGALPVVDYAALFVARNQGLFAEAGLDVRLEVLPGGSAAVPKLGNGSLDFSIINYVSAIQATASGDVPMKIIQDAYQLKPDACGVVVPEDSPIHRPADLKGKKIAVNTKNNVGELLVTAGLRTYGVTPKAEQFVTIDFPGMADALKNHDVDAAWAVEPFITQMEEQTGGRLILDSAKGPTVGFPIGVYTTTAAFARHNPNTTATFADALRKASEMVAADRGLVERVLPTYSKIDAKTASLIHLSTFSSTVNQGRGQQVADLMTQYGFLKNHFDIKPML